VTSADEFIEFATVASPRLRRTAFLLCGDWHTAEDLAQTTLAKMFAAWRRVSQLDAVYPYATRTLVNTYLAGRRRKRAAELLLSRLPDRAVEPPAPELRLVVLDALATLPPKARAVVVLRYWEAGQDREPHRWDRDHPGREDRLRRQLQQGVHPRRQAGDKAWHGDPHHARHQHAGETDQGRQGSLRAGRASACALTRARAPAQPSGRAGARPAWQPGQAPA